ncbi:MAG TPA: DUF2849 domain-containing protein [Methylocella sp.]|nr:DUF2849 domain-containing protein [Methylocella sp.]
MAKVISANRLADGIVVYAGRDGSWSEQLSQAKIFPSKAEAEAGLLVAQNDAKRNLVVEPVVVEVTEDASGLRAVTLRESIRARGPTIDFLPRTWAFARGEGPPPANSAKQGRKAVLRIPRLGGAPSVILESMNFMRSHDETTHQEQKRFDLKCPGYRTRVVAAESS